jgi:putative transposase
LSDTNTERAGQVPVLALTVVATRANEVWAMGFMSDQLFDCTRVRILTIVDVFTKLSPAVDVRRSYRGSDVVGTLERVTKAYGIPKEIRVDNGPEFISKDLDLWEYLNAVALEFSRPGKPTDNAFIESFNGKFREECLDASWFLSENDARSKCEAWRKEYNELRPHSSIGQQTPVEFALALDQASLA